MRKYYKFITAIAFFLAVALISFLFNYKPALAPENPESVFREMKINGQIIKVEIADTVEKRSKGLSGRKSMPENQGMLFVFTTPDHYSFWMKDMNFNLDFIWISGNEIVEITRNVRPEDYEPASTPSSTSSSLGGRANRGEPPKSLVPKNKIDKVLEVNAGAVDRLGIKEGDRLEF
ncbi:MAG: DUF192 domain-containing protein [Patescibacteria group bacterium]